MVDAKMIDISFDDQDDNMLINDLTGIDDDSISVPVPVKKLQDSFDNAAKVDTHLKVYLRIRPISEKLESTIKVDSLTSIITSAPETSNRAKYTKLEERHYTFNRIFGPDSSQSEVFNHVVEPLMDRFLVGESCVLFAYGMTNAGKTYTIQGCSQDPGSLPRLVQEVVAKTQAIESADLQISILEIYQDDIFDLLCKKKEKLKIRDGSGRVEVSKLTSYNIQTMSEALKLMDKAAANR
jgi:hypothetical protein